MSSSEEDNTPTNTAIGISFGNSYSSIACTLGGDAKVIANEEGDRQIPSILSYVDGEEFHGTQAKVQLVRNPSNTIVGFRDFVGKNFDAIDPTPCHAAAHPHKEGDTIAFKVHDKPSSPDAPSEPSTLTVHETTTRHLNRLKQSASNYLGRPVTSAVLTIPTDFTQAQRDALTSAAEAASLEILQLIPEPIAALLAHDVRSSASKPADKTVLVADLGGNRSDVAVVSVRGGMYSILSTSHDYALGGAQLDEVLVEYGAKEFLKKNKNATDPRTTDRSLAKLKLEAENVKKALSVGTAGAFNIEGLVDGIDFSLTVNRTRFDLLAGKIFVRFTRLLDEAVQKAGLDVLDIDEVLLSGGSSHTPRIASNIAGHFPETTTVIAPALSSTAANPSELTVRGAALQAFLVGEYEKDDIEQSTHPMVTVTPHLSKAIGLVVGEEAFKEIIPSETPLPVRRTITVTNTAGSGETSDVLLRLCEGVRDISVTKPEPKAKTNGVKPKDEEDEDDDDDDDEDEDEEEEEIRSKVNKIESVIGELAIRDVKKGARLTVQVNVGTDMEVSISAMEAGAGKPGVRGVVAGSEGTAVMNGGAR